VTLPERGVPAAEVLERMEALRGADVDWRAGRAFSLAYHGGDEVIALAREAYARFSSENALNVEAFPSLRRMQSEVVESLASLFHAGEPAGFLTSGGTESILLAVLAARERARAERGIRTPEMVLPTTAHAAFEKAAHYFGVRSVRVPVRGDFRADPAAMAAAVGEDTVLLVGSAPAYPQGVIDPIGELGEIAAARGLPLHVDSCMGMSLPFLERLGEPIPACDFRVPGVTSISVDLHKYGYTAKGASVILHRSRALRRYQTFSTDNWLGGAYGSSGVLGTKSGGAIAAAWAVLQHLGVEGYLRLTRKAREATSRLVAGVRAIPGLRVLAEPDTTLVAIGSDSLDPFAIGDALRRRGWYLDKQAPPRALHATVNAVHAAVMEAFLGDLAAATAEVAGARASGSAGAYATVE
jgi:glutamate/tyrosine decarboxylase-like PLP-dependent enzyme